MGLYREPLRKRSFTIQGHRTSVALEPEFWAEFDRAARERGVLPTRLMTEIDEARGVPLASALRVFLLKELRAALDRERAGCPPERKEHHG